MPIDAKKLSISDFNNSETDFGLEPLETPLTPEERKIAALTMAFNAAFVKLVLEGIIPFNEDLHFQMHAMDYADRLFKGEKLKFPMTKQTFSVDSVTGKVYADVAESYIQKGSEQFREINNAIDKAMTERAAAETGEDEEENKQTNKDEYGERPKYLN